MSYGRHPYGGVGYAGSDVAEIPADTEPMSAVEVSFTTDALGDPVWVDITPDVRSWSVSRGRTRELERFQPGRASAVFSNLNRQYDSSNVAGPWFGNLRAMRRIRFRETFSGATFPVFDGYVDKWHLDYPGVGRDATATVVATDAFKIFQRTNLPRSVYAHTVDADSPAVWWRFDEVRNTEADDDLKALNHGTLASTGDVSYVGLPGLGGESLIVNDPGTSMIVVSSGENPGTTSMGVLLDDAVVNLQAKDVWAVEAWVVTQRSEAGNNQNIFVTGVNGQLSTLIFQNVSGVVQFDFTVNSTTTAFEVESAQGEVPHTRRHVVARFTRGSPLELWVNSVKTTGDTPTGTFTTGDSTVGYQAVGEVTPGASNWVGYMSNVAIYVDAAASALTDSRIQAHHAAGTAPWQGDTPSARIDRVLNLADWPTSLREFDGGITTFQSAELNNMPVLEHLQKAAETELGLLFMSRDGKVRFVNFANQGTGAPVAPQVIGDGAGEVGYTAITFDDGDETIRNRATISRLNGVAKTDEDIGSVAEFGRFDYTQEGLLHRLDTHSQNVADLIVAEYSSPRRRVDSVTFESPPVGQEQTAYPMILGRELGDHVTVRNRPPGGGALFEQTAVIEGIRMSATPKHLTVTYALSPVITATL